MKEKTASSAPETASKPKNKRLLKISLSALVIVLLVLLSAGAIVSLYIDSKLDLINYVQPDQVWTPVSPGDIDDPDDEFESDPDAEVVLPEQDVFKDKDVLNILLIGTDERNKNINENARADSMMVLSLNKRTNSIKLVSLERGMSVKMPNGRIDLLTHAFRYGGPDWIISCVQSHFNLDVEKYIRVNFTVFEKIVDAIGGVDIELTRLEAAAMNQHVHTNTMPLDETVYEGWNHLDGFATLQYCRLRYTDSDWVRIVRQRKTIAAIKKECEDLSLSELNNLANEVLPLVHTNLDKDDVLSLMLKLPQFLKSDIEDMTIPAEGTFTGLGRVDFEANSKILHDFFYGENE